jgi:dihydrofolate synthase / folylpolyglutamate synthase
MTGYPEVQDYLFGLKAKGIKYGIDRMRGLAAAIGHPERTLPIIHLAGTNGKGSTAAMLDAILRQAGRRVGLYTSPHLVRLGERVQVDRIELTEEEIVAYTRELKPLAESLARGDESDHPSFFEFMTAMAFLQFQRRDCDVGIVEVGLGGELDATNVVLPTVTAITSIGLDHCEILGYTLPEIAAAKAGIIKPGIPVVIGRMPIEAEEVIRARAASLEAPLVSVVERFGQDLNHYPQSGMDGDCQRINAATATLLVELFDADIPADQVARGLAQANWPARWQHICWQDRDVILDASHNPEGAAELALSLTRLRSQITGPLHIVVGALGLARAGALMETVARFADRLYLLEPHQARACSYQELRKLIPKSFTGDVVNGSVEDLFVNQKLVEFTRPRETIVATGSIYLAGEVMAAINPLHPTPESHLQDF